MRAQTPQAFHLDVLQKAFERALAQGQVAVTDDVGIVQAYMPEQPIFIVSGEEANRKITYAEDLK
jgi:2-C-methyl-D-erythritol 4-phosphate cytidylyltransferase